MEITTDDTETTSTPQESWRTPILMGLVALAAVLLIAGFFSARSLPGDMLYPAKVRVTERVTSLFTFGTTARMEQDVARLEMRLAELRELGNDTATSTPGGLASLAYAVRAQSERAAQRIDNSSLSDGERIEALARLVHVGKALETTTESSPEFAPIAESVGDSREMVEDSLESLVQTFATTHPPETVGTFIGDHIQVVGQQLASVANGSDAQRRAIARIGDTQDALQDGDLGRAVESILNAEEAIAVDGYLFDSERGPVEGVPLPTVPEEG